MGCNGFVSKLKKFECFFLIKLTYLGAVLYTRVYRRSGELIAKNFVDDFIFKIIFKMMSFKYSVIHIQEIASCFCMFSFMSIVTSNIHFLHQSVEI